VAKGLERQASIGGHPLVPRDARGGGVAAGGAVRQAGPIGVRLRPAVPHDRLDSWKEIAAYLKRDVTTVRRWEKRQGLPVHRHLHEQRESVYAFPAEIDEWWEGRRHHLTVNGTGNGASSNPDNGATASADAGRARWLSRAGTAWSVATLFFVTTIVLAVMLLRRPATTDNSAGDELQFQLFPPSETYFGAASLSPDGRHLAFTTRPMSPSGGKPLLWIRSLDEDTVRPLPDTEDATYAFWSPTSDALGFFAGGKLWTIRIDGSNPRSIADAPEGRGGSWNRAGTIVFAPRSDGPLYRVASSSGAATPVTTLGSADERGHVWPEFLPDGNQFLYLADPPETRADTHFLYVGALDGAERRRVMSIASNVAYSPEGYLLFARDYQLCAQRFDAATATLSGEPLALIDRLEQNAGASHRAEFSISTTGRLMYRRMQSPENLLVWRDRTRRLAPLVSLPAHYQEPTFSPNDDRIAVAIFDPRPSSRFGYGVAHVRSNIFSVDRMTGAASPLTSDPSANWSPIWSPDGRRIVFTSNRRTPDLELFVRDTSDSSGAETPLVTRGLYPVAQSWSPDGRYLLYSAFNQQTRSDLWLLPMSGDQTPMPLLQGEYGEQQGRISPDGRWFAYASDESGRDEVYVQAFPTPTRKWRVSFDGGADPRWRRDGKELFYIADDRHLMGVPVKAGTPFDHGEAIPVFNAGVPAHWYFGRNVYDVSRDGRFLMMSPTEDDKAPPVTVLLNWPGALRKHSERAAR